MTILQNDKNFDVPPNRYGDDVESVLISKDSLQARIQKMADQVSDKYRDSENDLILVCVLKGAVFFITDFARALTIPSQVEFMAVSSYGNSTTSSGVHLVWCESSKTWTVILRVEMSSLSKILSTLV